MVITQNDIDQLTSTGEYGTHGDKIGSVGQVYLDAQSGDPKWVTVETALFGTKETFVRCAAPTSPTTGSLAYAKDQIKDAPQIGADGPLSYAEGDQALLVLRPRLARRKQRQQLLDLPRRLLQPSGETRGAAGQTAADTGSPSNEAMTRSEERLVTGMRAEEVGKARLRKRVMTDQQVAVPVSHEETSSGNQSPTQNATTLATVPKSASPA
jgi:stress response protein YsnF